MATKKIWYSITELVELGYPRRQLNYWARAKGAPVFRTSARGMYKFDITRLNAFINEYNRRNGA